MKALCKDTLINFILFNRLGSTPVGLEIIEHKGCLAAFWSNAGEGNNNILVTNDYVIFVPPKNFKADGFPKRLLNGSYKIPYKSENIKVLDAMFRAFFSYGLPLIRPDSFSRYLLEPDNFVGLEFRWGREGLDYPSIPTLVQWFSTIDTPFLDSDWCKKNHIAVVFTEIINNGIAFNITCEGSWIREHDLLKLTEMEEYSRFVRPDFKAKYFGNFYKPITSPDCEVIVPGIYHCEMSEEN